MTFPNLSTPQLYPEGIPGGGDGANSTDGLGGGGSVSSRVAWLHELADEYADV